MQINILKIAEAVENALLEDVANGRLADFHIQCIPDDNEIVIQVIKPVKHIKVNYVLRKGSF